MNTKNMDVYEHIVEEFYSKARNRTLIRFAYKATNDEIFECVAVDKEFAKKQLDKWIKKNNLLDAPIF